MTMESIPKIDSNDVRRIEDFIRSVADASGCSGVVIGLSGGLDSAVVTKLCVDALGNDKVLNIFMPSGAASDDDLIAAKELSTLCGTELKVISVQPAVESFLSVLSSDGDMDRGNISSRCRMIILYNIARRNNLLVMGTSNKSELMMGYFTKYGDGGCDVVPIADLYKTQVRELARMIGVPESFIMKPPSAGFWAGQTDEDEMHITYSELDRILFGLEKGMGEAEIADYAGVTLDKVSEIISTVRKTAHKRTMPVRPTNI